MLNSKYPITRHSNSEALGLVIKTLFPNLHTAVLEAAVSCMVMMF